VDLESLRSNFRRDGRLAPQDQPVFELVAGDDVPYAKVTELMALARSAGVRTMGIGELQQR
jgi:biopolymer transport protein ExbD